MTETSGWEKTKAGGRFVAKLLTSALWAAGGVIAAASGAPLAAVVAAVYLAYLWFFNGRFLIY